MEHSESPIQLLSTSPFSSGSTSLPNSPPPPPQLCMGMGNGDCGQFITPCPCCSFLLLFCSSVGFLPRVPALHEPTMDGSLSFCPSTASPWAQSHSRAHPPALGRLLQGLQVQLCSPGSSWAVGAQPGLPWPPRKPLLSWHIGTGAPCEIMIKAN